METKTYKAYCLTKIVNGGKFYIRPDLKTWTTNPIYADFYERLCDVQEELQYQTNKDESVHQYMIEYDPNYKKPEYKIDEVEIKFLSD